jgi:hypothetical protein
MMSVMEGKFGAEVTCAIGVDCSLRVERKRNATKDSLSIAKCSGCSYKRGDKAPPPPPSPRTSSSPSPPTRDDDEKSFMKDVAALAERKRRKPSINQSS